MGKYFNFHLHIYIYICICSISLHTHNNISKIAHSPPSAHYPSVPFSVVIKIFGTERRGAKDVQVHQQYTDSSPPWSPLCLQAVTARAFICNTRKTLLSDWGDNMSVYIAEEKINRTR